MSAPDTAAAPAEPLGLKAKLLLIRRGMKRLPKNGWNDHHKYRYVRSEDAVAKVNRLLDRYDVLLKPSVNGPHEVSGTTTYVPMRYVFEDVETGQVEIVDWLGAGQDKGDKGVYKAYTGALKFFLIQFFQVQVGDAPEPEATDADGRATVAAPAEDSKAKDAERAAATRIPVDRAKAILDQATEAGLVNPDDSFSAVFKAQLADVGVRKIGALDVDQAEVVEAFVAAELKAKAENAAQAEREGEGASS